MTREERVSLLLEVYEQEKERLNKEYQERLMNMQYVEIDPEEVNRLNEWKEHERAAIENRFKKAIIAMEG